MGTTADELKYSEPPQRICGQDELYAADVVQTDDGKNRLCTETRRARYHTQSDFIKASECAGYFFGTETTYPGSPNYTTNYSVTGKKGLLFGFHIDSDTDKLQVRFIADGKTIFEFEVKALKDLDFKTARGQQYQARQLFCTSGDDFDFSPCLPIRFESGFSIAVKKSNGNDLKIKRVYVFATEEGA